MTDIFYIKINLILRKNIIKNTRMAPKKTNAKKAKKATKPSKPPYFTQLVNNAKSKLLQYTPNFIRQLFSSASKEKRKPKSRMLLYFTKKELDIVRPLLLSNYDYLSTEQYGLVRKYFKSIKYLSIPRRSPRNAIAI
jgi:hypothetical protein